MHSTLAFVPCKSKNLTPFAFFSKSMFTNYAATEHLKGPYPNEPGASKYTADTTKPLDFSYFKALNNILGASDTGIAQITDLIGKMVHKNPKDRLAGPMKILAHPFFTSVGITFKEVIEGGIEAAINDNKLNAHLLAAPAPISPKPLPIVRPKSVILNDLIEILEEEAEKDELEIQVTPDAKGPVLKILQDIDVEPTVPPKRKWSSNIPLPIIKYRDSLVAENMRKDKEPESEEGSLPEDDDDSSMGDEKPVSSGKKNNNNFDDSSEDGLADDTEIDAPEGGKRKWIVDPESIDGDPYAPVNPPKGGKGWTMGAKTAQGTGNPGKFGGSRPPQAQGNTNNGNTKTGNKKPSAPGRRLLRRAAKKM